MAIDVVRLGTTTSTAGAEIVVDQIDLATSTDVLVQRMKVGFGVDGSYADVSASDGLPVAIGTTATLPVSIGTWTATGQVLTSPLPTATQPVSVGTWTATGQVLTSPLATATQPVSVGTWTATGRVLIDTHSTATIPVSIAGTVAVDGSAVTQPVSVGTWTATGQVLTSPLATATQPVSVGTWTATGQVLTSPLATATQPVSVGTWTATGEVRVIQDLDSATDLNVTTHPFGPIGDQVLAFTNITATTVATVATAAGSNNFLDLVGLYVSNHATSPQSISIRDTSTSTQFNPMIAGDGGGFIWQPAKPTRPHTSNNPWTVQTSAATGIKVTAQFQTAT